MKGTKMKKVLLLAMLMFVTFSIAVAQSAMSKKDFANVSITSENLATCTYAEKDVVQVEIIGSDGNHYSHPQHPESGVSCIIFDWFTTENEWTSYLWETSSFGNCGVFDDRWFSCSFSESGYLKLTVWDDMGNSGSDSIWFNIKTDLNPLDDFLMEVDDDLHANFFGATTEEHAIISIYRANDAEGFVFAYESYPSPGLWSFVDSDVQYQENDLWIYLMYLTDTCGNVLRTVIPGMMLSVEENDGSYCLLMQTILGQYGDYYHQFDDWVYFVYTIDQDGNLHHFVQNGEPVVLLDNIMRWEIPDTHVDPYYQCGVARILEDGTYELLSLSNKVLNPLLDPDGIVEKTEAFCIYPNPAQSHFTVEGTGAMTVTNTIGQTILTKEIIGKETVDLPKGLYFVKMNGVTRKIVVE